MYCSNYTLRGIYTALGILLALSCFAQTKEIDSLKRSVKDSKGTEKIDALNALAFRQVLMDYTLALETLDESMELSKKQNYIKGLAEANIYKGMCENNKGNKAAALHLIPVGIQYAKTAKLSGLEGYGLVQMGNVYRIAGQYDSANYWYSNSYSVLKDSLNPWQLSVLYRNRAMLYNATSKPQLELHYLMKSYTIRKQLPDKILFTDILLLLAEWHRNQDEFITSAKFLEEALSVKDIPSESEIDIKYERALVFLNEGKYLEALELLKEVEDSYLKLGTIYNYVNVTIEVADLLEELGSNELSVQKCYEAIALSRQKNFKKEEVLAKLVLSWNFYDTRQFKLAKDTILSVIDEAQRFQFEAEVAAAENLMGKILTDEKKYYEALVHYNVGLKIRQRLKNPQGCANILANMSDTYLAMGEFNHAVEFVKRSIAIADSIQSKRNIPWNYLRLVDAYTAGNDYKNAVQYLRFAEEKGQLLLKSSSRNAKDFQFDFFESKRRILIGQSKFQEALQLSMLMEQLRDSLNETNAAERIVAVQSSYQLNQKAIELKLRSDEIAIQKAEILKQRLIILGVLVISALLGVLLYVSYSFYKKTRLLNHNLKERNKEIQSQSESLAKLNAALQSSNRELTEKNEEIQTQAEELTEANASLSRLNHELAEKQEELQAQSEELTESHESISKLNESLEQKVEDRTLQLKQAFKELDTFFYRSSHDFRRPLTTFMGLAEVAKITVTDKNALDLFEKVKETAVNLDGMLIKLQSISDVGAEQYLIKPIDIQSIFDSALQTYREAIESHKIKVTLKIDGIQTLNTYPAFLKIIMDNLVENVIHFSKVKDPHMHLEATSNDGGVQISVKDNGIGIEKEHLNRVFDMFFRGSERSKGNGLGLYIVKKAVSKIQGQLDIESNIGEGTTIRIWIPLQLQ